MACLPLFCPLLSSFLSSILSSILSFCSCVCLSFCPLCSCFYLFSCFPRLVLLAAWLLLLVLSSLFVGCCCFFFPYGCMRKKKGRKVLFFASSLSVLFSRSNSCNVVKKLRCRCFGFFQFVRFILPTNTTGVGRLAGSHLNPFRHNVNITDNPPAFLKYNPIGYNCCFHILGMLWVDLSGCCFIFLVLVRCQPVYIVIKF